MWNFAIKTLVADRGKLFTALVGVVFSIVLVNMQGGLFLGLISKAGLLVDNGEADIWVGHRKMHNVDFPRDIPRRWIQRIRAIDGVARAEPYLVGQAEMTLPSGGYETVVVVGVERAGMLGNAWNIKTGSPELISKPDGIIVDNMELEKIEYPEIGDIREIGGRRARVVAKSDGIMGFLVTPYVFTTYERAASYLRKSPNSSSYFLVQVRDGANVDEICSAINSRVPDVEAFSSTKYSQISANFWITRTGIGISFGAATALGLLVGLIMVAQTLYTMVLDRISEFGTLKAIGAKESHILSILVSQALAMALLGSMLGLAAVSVLQRAYSTPRAPIVIPGWLAIGSCVLVLVICLLSALLPYWRVRRVDPVMVLQN